jgi:uncharacterized protein YjiS (DUF1127 family)
MSTSKSLGHGLLTPVYRALGWPASDQHFEPDGPSITGSLIECWRKRRRYRWHLRRIIDHSPELLTDIGLTERTAEAEIAKPFWRP